MFHNRCHLRTHILSHLEVDGLNSVCIGGPESLDVCPLTPSELNIGFIDDAYSEELEAVYKDYVLQNSHQNVSKCIECRLPVTDLSDHFQQAAAAAFEPNKHHHFHHIECNTCKMQLPTKCSLRYATL